MTLTIRQLFCLGRFNNCEKRLSHFLLCWVKKRIREFIRLDLSRVRQDVVPGGSPSAVLLSDRWMPLHLSLGHSTSHPQDPVLPSFTPASEKAGLDAHSPSPESEAVTNLEFEPQQLWAEETFSLPKVDCLIYFIMGKS